LPGPYTSSTGTILTAARQEQFFRVVFGEHEGYVCLARRKAKTRQFEEEFFLFPKQLSQMVAFAQEYTATSDMYFCPQLLDKPKRVKENVKICPTLWADLDTCPPDKLLVTPTITVETSPNRYQAYWLIKSEMDPGTAEDLSRRIAYYHEDDGADKTGWDLTQLLRVPYTYNHKYQGLATVPQVAIISTHAAPLDVEDFKDYPEAEGFEYSTIPFPDVLVNDPEKVLDNHRAYLHPQVWPLFTETPTEDWSRYLWLLENYLFEANLTREEVFVVCRAAKCNKYSRDGRSEKLLWKDVCRAWAHVQEKAKGHIAPPTDTLLPDLLSDTERATCMVDKTIVEEYIEWAKTLGDAAWQYHEAGAFTVLSSLLAGPVRLPTSFGMVLPNLWFMILADTTLTRKTTAMDIAMDVISEIDPDAILATDGSIEGLMTSLSMRPGRPSIFLRDEFSGLLEALTKKDYYAGMAESLTKLYDGKLQKRILRKETIEVRDPVLILFAGGIRSRVLELLTHEHISSGFIPRFVFVTAESDVSTLKPLGPPTEKSLEGRAEILEKFRQIHKHYSGTTSITVGDKTVTTAKRWDVELTPQAWLRYNQFEAGMLDQALKSPQMELLTPVFDRLAKSGLKVAMLIAASRVLGDKVLVSEGDIVRAFYYIEKWRWHTIQVIKGVGTTFQERTVEKVLKSIRVHPGIARSQLMQNHHLMRNDADRIFDTLEQRGLVNRVRSGRAEKLFPVATEG
jgi:ribosomal protein S25